MSLETKFIDLCQKLETAFKEMRVGFPEGLKQQLLAWSHDVAVWMSAHYMVVTATLAVALTLVVSGFSYTFFRRNKHQLALITALETESDWLRTQLVAYKEARDVWKSAWVDQQGELCDQEEELAAKCSLIAELKQTTTEFAERITELEGELQDVREDRDHWENKWDITDDELIEARGEIKELDEKVESLTELNEQYAELVSKLDEVALAA